MDSLTAAGALAVGVFSPWLPGLTPGVCMVVEAIEGWHQASGVQVHNSNAFVVVGVSHGNPGWCLALAQSQRPGLPAGVVSTFQ